VSGGAGDLYELAEQRLEDLETAGCSMRETGEGEWRGRCPLCGKDDLTLRVDEDRERLWLSCFHQSCAWREVHRALGVIQSDLRLSSTQAKRRNESLRNPDLNAIRPIRSALAGRILIGKPSLLIANEGTGKGVVSAYLAAGWTRGAIEGDLYCTPISVLIIGDEDTLEDTWTPRLSAAGADFDRVFFQQVDDFDIDFTEPGDIEHLRGWILRYEVRAVIFDALLDHVGGINVDEFKAKAVRHALRPLRRLSAEQDIVILGSMHPRKGRVGSFRDLIANSHQFNAASRSSLLLANHPDDEGEEGRRVLVVGKKNHAGRVAALEFRIEAAIVVRPSDGMEVCTEHAVDWAECEITLQDAMEASTRGPGRPLDEGKWNAVIAALAEEPKSANTIARDAGVARSTAQGFLADLEIDQVARKDEGGGWVRGPSWGGRQSEEQFSATNFRPPPKAAATPVNTGDLASHRGGRKIPAENSTSVCRPPPAKQEPLFGNGQIDPEESRRERAREAIHQAREQAGADHD
jgi:hypothetical protein